MIAAFEAAFGSGKNDLGHVVFVLARFVGSDFLTESIGDIRMFLNTW
jgi:hypothetical protein